jgi:UDP-N-acetylglucosamine transferase subunit ALG13
VTSVDFPEADAAPVRPLLLVTVGSDHHPFDRLVRWVDNWLADGGAEQVHCVMQYGAATPPHNAGGEAFMGHDVLQRLMASAAIIIMQGGPMGLLEARMQGSVPISVPRRRDLGEVVDDHQAAFCRQMQATGDTVMAEDEAALRQCLEAALARPLSVRSEPIDFRARTRQSIARFAEEADALLAGRDAVRQRRHRLLPSPGASRKRQLLQHP